MTEADPRVCTHRVVPTFIITGNGRTFERTFLVHRSRRCENCWAFGPRNALWLAEHGAKGPGKCLHMCSAADASNADERWCPSHQTPLEANRGINRPEAPALMVAGLEVSQ